VSAGQPDVVGAKHAVEVLFGVKDRFGKGTDEAIKEISCILRHAEVDVGRRKFAPAPISYHLPDDQLDCRVRRGSGGLRGLR
jgi:hypothetical protein